MHGSTIAVEVDRRDRAHALADHYNISTDSLIGLALDAFERLAVASPSLAAWYVDFQAVTVDGSAYAEVVA